MTQQNQTKNCNNIKAVVFSLGLITWEGGEETIGEHETWLIFDPKKTSIQRCYSA